jgi:hypothetical protein
MLEPAWSKSVGCCQSWRIIKIPNDSEKLTEVNLVIRGEISKRRCLILEGITGTPLHKIPKNHWETHRAQIIKEVCNTLKYAHTHKIFTFDVRPGHIIARNCRTKADCQVWRNDWGCVTEHDGIKPLTMFRGCTPCCAHNNFLGQEPDFFEIVPELDL